MSGKVSKTAFKKAVKKAFITQEKGINYSAASYADRTVEDLFKTWNSTKN